MPVSEAETTVPRYTHQCIACGERIDARRINRKEDQCFKCQRGTTNYEGGDVFEVFRSIDDYWIIRDSVTEVVTQGPTKEFALEMFCDMMSYRNKAGGIDIHWIKAIADEIGPLAKPFSDAVVDHSWDKETKTWSQVTEDETTETSDS